MESEAPLIPSSSINQDVPETPQIVSQNNRNQHRSNSSQRLPSKPISSRHSKPNNRPLHLARKRDALVADPPNNIKGGESSDVHTSWMANGELMRQNEGYFSFPPFIPNDQSDEQGIQKKFESAKSFVMKCGRSFQNAGTWCQRWIHTCGRKLKSLRIWRNMDYRNRLGKRSRNKKVQTSEAEGVVGEDGIQKERRVDNTGTVSESIESWRRNVRIGEIASRHSAYE